ncbi:PLDc N-terminal domain-containing protein [uncultured Tessaracoccus sp.]|uniref:PLDc N-terminal domain-containing protein n=1 Tax=uncultured Tessaracoccus sp. TaxID=905023 RepID=UPI0025E210CF|nr:PLDc N-terminal domain-containing protein [uncultured Tessaracoccus sp.]
MPDQDPIAALAALPLAVQLLIAGLAVLQLALMVVALVRLARWPEQRLAGLPKPAWVAIVLLGQLVGSVAFLLVHRRARADAEARKRWAASQQAGDAPSGPGDVVERLYHD